MNIETPFSFSSFETNGKEMHCANRPKQQTWAKGGKSLNTLPPPNQTSQGQSRGLHGVGVVLS